MTQVPLNAPEDTSSGGTGVVGAGLVGVEAVATLSTTAEVALLLPPPPPPPHEINPKQRDKHVSLIRQLKT